MNSLNFNRFIIWKDIPGFIGMYKCSNHGDILSLSRKVWGGKAFYEIKRKLIKHVLCKSTGYPMVTLNYNGVRNKNTVHSIVMQTFCGEAPKDTEVMHLDGNRVNPLLSNLRYGSRQCNLAFMVDHGTVCKKRGDDSKNTKIISSMLSEICDLHFNKKYSRRRIAKIYSVSHTTIDEKINNYIKGDRCEKTCR